jgi:hypothetical protein
MANGPELLNELLVEGYDGDLTEGDFATADVLLFFLFDWDDLDAIAGAREFCGAACSVEESSKAHFTRNRTVYFSFQSRKFVFVDLNIFATLTDEGESMTFSEDQLSCLQEVLVGEVKFFGGQQSYDCLSPLTDETYTMVDTISFNLGWY